MAWAGAGAEQGFAAGDGTDEDNVGQGDGRLCQVATGEWRLVNLCEGEEAIEEALKPVGASFRRCGAFARQTDRKKGGDGACAHGGQVAKPSC